MSQNNISCRKRIFLLDEKRSPKKQNHPTCPTTGSRSARGAGPAPDWGPQCVPNRLACFYPRARARARVSLIHPRLLPLTTQRKRAVTTGLMSAKQNKKGKNKTPTLTIQKFYFTYNTRCIKGHVCSHCYANEHGLGRL